MPEGTIPLTADLPVQDEVAGWVRQARQGDLDAFDRLVVRFERRVFALVWQLLGNPEDAREVAQETFLRAYRALSSFREGAPFEPWLFRIAVNLASNERRRRGSAGNLVAVEDVAEPREPEGSGAEETVLRDERSRLLREALLDLSPRERAAVVLRELQGLSTEEVAEVLDLDPVTVRRHVSRALDRLRRLIAERHPELLR